MTHTKHKAIKVKTPKQTEHYFIINGEVKVVSIKPQPTRRASVIQAMNQLNKDTQG